jgi:hypothetical protein
MTGSPDVILPEVAYAFSVPPLYDVASNEVYQSEEGNAVSSANRTRAKADYLNSDVAWPEITEYPYLDQDELDATEQFYWNLLDTAWDFTEGEDGINLDADVLFEQIAQKIGEINRHREVLRLLGSISQSNVQNGNTEWAVNFREHAAESAETARLRAANMNGELFGEPEQVMFDRLLAQDIRTAVKAANSDDTDKAVIAREYLHLLGYGDVESAAAWAAGIPNPELYELEDETMRIIRDDIFAIFPTLEDELRPFMGLTEDVSPVDAVPAFEAVQRAMELDEIGYTVRIIPGSTTAAEAKYRTKETIIGEKRADFSPQTIYTRPIHEAMHEKRYENTQKQKQLYLRTELPGNLHFEEGFPSAIEQVMVGKTRVPGEKYYLQIGLFKGMYEQGGDREQSFRKVHDIMWRRAVLQEKGSVTEAEKTKLKSAAYGSVLRTARGGARDNRDITYFIGGQKAAKFLNETASLPEELRRKRLVWAMSGRFDPTNPTHAKLFGGDPAEEYLQAA